jgi:glycine/D-amino acid oxidase-like deaminating enzyme
MWKKRYDLLVIGAGVIGLSSAFHIKQTHPDLSVLIIDRSLAAGQGDTAKSMAAVRDTFTSDVNRTLARSAIEFYKHVQFELGFNLNLDLVGYLWLLSQEQAKAYDRVEAEMRKQGTRLRTLERNELTQLIPDLVLDPSSEQSKLMELEGVSKGLQGLDCGTVAPELITKFYENELNKLGVDFEFGTEANRIHLGAKRSLGIPGEPFVWQDKLLGDVETNHGTLSADTILLAAGTRNPLLLDPLGIDCMIKPRKNQVFQLRGPSLERLLTTKGFNEQNTTPFTILPKGEIYFRPVPRERSL